MTRASLSPLTVHERFALMLRAAKLPAPVTEHRFAKPRRWAFDYCWPEQMIALEVEGGVWTQGRHTRGSGYLKDIEKYNAAVSLGWRLFRVTPSQLPTAETLELLSGALEPTTRRTVSEPAGDYLNSH